LLDSAWRAKARQWCAPSRPLPAIGRAVRQAHGDQQRDHASRSVPIILDRRAPGSTPTTAWGPVRAARLPFQLAGQQSRTAAWSKKGVRGFTLREADLRLRRRFGPPAGPVPAAVQVGGARSASTCLYRKFDTPRFDYEAFRRRRPARPSMVGHGRGWWCSTTTPSTWAWDWPRLRDWSFCAIESCGKVHAVPHRVGARAVEVIDKAASRRAPGPEPRASLRDLCDTMTKRLAVRHGRPPGRPGPVIERGRSLPRGLRTRPGRGPGGQASAMTPQHAARRRGPATLCTPAHEETEPSRCTL